MAENAPETGENATPLPIERLYRAADLSKLDFKTTADLEPVEGLIGQSRALDAITVGTGIVRQGFNLFAIGPAGALTRKAVEQVLKEAAEDRPAPTDWVYVNNFKEPQKPIAIALPAGRAAQFRDAMGELIEALKAAIPAVFQSEEYQTRRGSIDEAFQKQQSEAFAELQKKAAAQSIVIVRTPLGFTLMPAREGEVIPPNEFNALPEDERDKIQAVIETLEKDLEHIIHQIPQWEKERRDEIRRVNTETAQVAVEQPIAEAVQKVGDIERVAAHLDAVQADLIENISIFVGQAGGGEPAESGDMIGGPFDRYEVNVLVSAEAGDGRAPVIEELHPTLPNLTGRIEHIARQGVLITNFRLIKPGALHMANGGYLMLDARSLLTEAFSYQALKRALRQKKIVIEDVSRLVGMSSTISLEPDPIPLDVKVVLFGDRVLYYMLSSIDPEIGEHFKVVADFEDDFERSPENEAILARFVASILAREELKAMDRDAVALVLEHASRLAENAGKLTLMVDEIRDILAEADYWAGAETRETVARADVRKALDERIRRAARLRDRSQEMILDKVALIDTDGARVGQLNGLSVLSLGGFAFGRPSRITCQVTPGSGKVVDIEREVELGGPIHSKGVLILAGFLSGRFALDIPMSLSASLVFEQSYGGVEGDSASSAELYTLLSAIAEIPLRQDLAVTGSVNQHGDVQAIGGANDKIEGFFDICNARGLTGSQGVLIPEANVRHLMLRDDVVEACKAGRFAVYPIATIDQGIALLTGRPAGTRGADGRYPDGSVYRAVEDRLQRFAEIRRSFGRGGEGGSEAKS
ncbi:Lon protease family protein [Microbaculum marinisediminis]|uniref:endopeptidase La n=1 Tax=Microbaculum marinisediminis TaxID=2931392 RepID=A0AAW5R3M6_9HYPH|nr:ATP-binding protein [Microbaculum sp. A6E488]MCT8974822.1 AAA family ATPase [Microbaculum sp. A6E488]